MILDNLNLFSDEQAVTASAASANVIDLSEERRVGSGEPVLIVVNVVETFADAGSDSTVTVTLQSDDNEAFSSAATVATFGTFGALAAAGSRLLAYIPPDVATERYIRLFYTVANGNLSAGKITAGIVKDADTFRAYPDGFTVS